MSGASDWDGRPRVNADGDLEAVTQDEFGNRYPTVIFRGKVHGYRCGLKASPDEPPRTITLFAGAEIHVEVRDYVEDRKTILDWVRGAMPCLHVRNGKCLLSGVLFHGRCPTNGVPGPKCAEVIYDDQGGI